jgi:hypothetical protein
MDFKETYRTEVMQSRRDRSRRAFFWARFFGLALMLTIGATLRSEPELRKALASAGMDAVMAVAGRTQNSQTAALAPQSASLPKSHFKVNRFSSPVETPDQSVDPDALAAELGRALAAQGRSN